MDFEDLQWPGYIGAGGLLFSSQSASAAAYPAVPFKVDPASPDAGYHPLVTVARAPSSDLSWLPSREEQGLMPIELLITAGAMSLIYLWHVLRARFETFLL